ncbi:MAG: IS110 family transposase [Betaproteobacteria bacterium]|nr:IS110 family transposase [Betaproteobacteria bacterium]
MFYLGIDVSKAKLDCCLLNQDAPEKRKSKVVANSVAGVADLLLWMGKQGAQPSDTHALLEATGVYHESAATALHDSGVTVSILNPAQVRDFGKGLGLRTKTDAVDSYLLARFGLLQKPPTWQPAPAHVRTLRALLSRRQALSEDLQREHNRLEKAQVTETPERIHQSLRDCIDFLERQLAQLEKDIDDHIDQHPDLKQDLALLQSVPAVGPQVGSHLLCVMRSSAFRTAEQLAAYLGVVPVERQSGTSVRGRAHLSKAGSARIRALLYMSALVGIRYNRHVKALYERLLAKGKSKIAALGAAMRKIVHLCFGVLKNRTPYMENFLSHS